MEKPIKHIVSLPGGKDSTAIEGVFLPTVGSLSSGITDALSTLGNSINEANGDFDKISEAIGTAMGEIANTILEHLPTILDTAGSLVSGLGNAIVDNLPMLIETASKLVFSILQGLVGALPDIAQGALQLVMTLVDGIVANLPRIYRYAL